MEDITKPLQKVQAAIRDDSVANLKAAARAIVELRSRFEWNGLPDWAGHSIEYRYHIERLYREAGVPSDSEGPLQARLRYHVSNVVREVAPLWHLEELGLLKNGARVRNRLRRRKAPVPVTESDAAYWRERALLAERHLAARG
jgi:hypothetical protein